MNRLHHWICSSNRWKRIVAEEIVPRVLDGVNLGSHVLEVGPGPGLATELLRKRCPRLTCLEIDPVFALPLRDRMKNTNVTDVEGDGTNMQFPDSEFSSVIICHDAASRSVSDSAGSLIHRSPPRFATRRRVCRHGCAGYPIASADGGDTYVPIDPDHLEPRFKRAGFEDVSIKTERRAFSFFARRTEQHATL